MFTRFLAALVVLLGLIACEAGPASETDIQRMKDEVAADIGDLASFKSELRQSARSRGVSWERIEAVAQAIDFEAYRVCVMALIEEAIDDALEANPGANVKAIEKATLVVMESPEYQANQAGCVGASLRAPENRRHR